MPAVPRSSAHPSRRPSDLDAQEEYEDDDYEDQYDEDDEDEEAPRAPSFNYSPNDLLVGSGGKSATFHEIGDRVEGVIISQTVSQQRDMVTRQLKTWDDGNPMLQVVITLQTEERGDDDDDGKRLLYVKIPGGMKAAIQDAVRKAKVPGIETGGYLEMEFVDEEPAKKRGLNPSKVYEAVYKPPAGKSAPKRPVQAASRPRRRPTR